MRNSHNTERLPFSDFAGNPINESWCLSLPRQEVGYFLVSPQSYEWIREEAPRSFVEQHLHKIFSEFINSFLSRNRNVLGVCLPLKHRLLNLPDPEICHFLDQFFDNHKLVSLVIDRYTIISNKNRNELLALSTAKEKLSSLECLFKWY